MTDKAGLVCAIAALLASTPAVAAPPPADRCAALDQLYRYARTEFPALRHKGFEGAACKFASHSYECAWSFSTDRYGDAETQVDRLESCTAAEPGATAIAGKRHEKAFQLNPETSVVIRGPDPDAGYWNIQLKVETSADWD